MDSYASFRDGRDTRSTPRHDEMLVLTTSEAAAEVERRTRGLPVTDVHLWFSVSSMPYDLVDRQLELIAGPFRTCPRSRDIGERRFAMGSEELERRIRGIEDRLEIQNLLGAHGPTVDAGEATAAASPWVEDGIYETSPEPLNGAEAIRAMVEGDMHQSFVGDGCAHLQGPAHVTLDGNRAVAIIHSLLLPCDPDRDGSAYGAPP
jgi:hypothetical protein